MVPELEKPRVIEIQVRMDCNGCKQKIKKALLGIHGIYETYIDFPQQKLTVVGWVDPEKLVKAIKKTRKVATICSHTEPSDPAPQPTEPAPESGPPAPDDPNSPPTEAPPTESAPPPEPPKDPPQPENPAPDVAPTPIAVDTHASQPVQLSRPKDVEEIHVIYHHPPEYGYSYGQGYSGPPEYGYIHGPGYYPNGYGFQPELPTYVTHRYSSYKPSPYIAKYEYVRSPPRQARYSGKEHYSEDYPNRSNGNGNNITSLFSDENPNACIIV